VPVVTPVCAGSWRNIGQSSSEEGAKAFGCGNKTIIAKTVIKTVANSRLFLIV
jgi:hypothetical protein